MAAKRGEVRIKAGYFQISATECEKLLGGQLHQSRKWNQHISEGES